MSAFRSYRTVALPALTAALFGLTLSACEPNKAPTQQSASPAQGSAAIEPAAPPAPALQELDAVARKVKLSQVRLCNIEMINGAKPTQETTVPKDPARVVFSGWLGNEKTGLRPSDARLRFETLTRQQAWEWGVGAPVARKDVAKAMNVPTLEDGGFQTTVDLSPLPQGEYRVFLVFGDANEAFLCDNGRLILR